MIRKVSGNSTVTGVCLNHLLFFSNDIVFTSSSVRMVSYCMAILWVTSGHYMSDVERVRNNAGIPSCLIVLAKVILISKVNCIITAIVL